MTLTLCNRFAVHPILLFALFSHACAKDNDAKPVAKLDYQVEIDTVLKHDDGKFLWYHPRVAPLPGFAPANGTAVLMTIQKHLSTSDHYSGLYAMRTDDLGRTWTSPDERPELAWVPESNEVDIASGDVTPAWHAPTGKVIAVGARVRYNKKGEQLNDKPRSHQTAYAVYDPRTNKWTPLRRVELPEGDEFNLFNLARSACSQWVVREDGMVLLPFYHGLSLEAGTHITVIEFSFDGENLKYVRKGNTLALPNKPGAGLYEPSLIKYDEKYYLTVRELQGAYVSTSDDGLNYSELKPWTFDDGSDLGSYNTQQHWLAHSDGLLLVYTRRGANNDHIPRHRAPLFIGQVDPSQLCIIRNTERVLIPERGGELGNFGASAINTDQSWVTVSEGVWDDDSRRRGAEGATFVAHILWAKPNQLMQQLQKNK